MRLPWNEVRTRAAAFAEEWQGATYEKGGDPELLQGTFPGVRGEVAQCSLLRGPCGQAGQPLRLHRSVPTEGAAGAAEEL